LTLSAGSKIGSFEVVGLLGVGGMGEVYRARDSKLNRDVALKVLPAALIHDAQRVARFRREAQVLASINHPNIGAIHGLEDASGITALVLELVDGPTLADRVARGPIPVTEALPIAAQISSALEAAHDQGIVHRDLKPANIKLRPDGTVKVLDFGLAKATERADQSADLTNSPTMVSPATQAGILLGTAAYMSPEQARGQAVDRRTDIWAFGCVLYEMLTARPPFGGDHVSDVLASVVRGTPDWSAIPADAQPLLPVLQRCLQKDAKQRLRDAADVELLIEDAVAQRTKLTMEVAPAKKRLWPIIAGTGVGLVAGAIAAIVMLRPPAPQVQDPPKRFELKLSQADPLSTDLYGQNVALSPDGSRIVYTSTRGGTSRLVMRRSDQLEGKPIAGSEGGFDPFFSPDGQHIGFATFGEFRRVAVTGGPSTKICPLDAYFSGASWADDDTIVFAEASLGIFRVQASGGQPERLILPDATKAEQAYAHPTALPGGASILYGVLLSDGSTRIAGRRIGDTDSVTLVDAAFGPLYLSRRLVFAQADRVMAAEFDAKALRVTGQPRPIATGVLNKDNATNFATTADGNAAYISGHDVSLMHRLAWVDRSATHIPIGEALEYPRNLRVSPDGRRLALTIGPGGRGQIWIYDLKGTGQPVKLTVQGHNLFPIWSPDSKQIAFLSREGSQNRLLLLPVDGSSTQPEPLIKEEFVGVPTGWSPDGNYLLVIRQPPAKMWLTAIRDRTLHQWLQTPFSEWGGRFSPDGHWVTYASDQTGTSEVWVRPFPGPGAPVRISPDGGQKSLWSKDGKEIFYENGAKVMVARVTTHGSQIEAEPAHMLFEGGFERDETDPHIRFLDAAADGRLLVVEANRESNDASLVIAQHWDANLQK